MLLCMYCTTILNQQTVRPAIISIRTTTHVIIDDDDDEEKKWCIKIVKLCLFNDFKKS